MSCVFWQKPCGIFSRSMAATEPHNSRWIIVLAGAAALFVELAMIRYIPGQVRVLGYFTNFVLLAGFLGLGLGMVVAQRWPTARRVSFLAPFALLLMVGATELGNTFQVLPAPEHFLFLEYATEGRRIPPYPFLVVSFALLAASFVPLGHFVGLTLKGDQPLLRYGLNVLGSLIGISCFAMLAATMVPAWGWMLVAALFALGGLTAAPARWKAAGALSATATVLLVVLATQGSIWSPYHKLTVGPIHVAPTGHIVPEWMLPHQSQDEREALSTLPEEEGFTVLVNDDSYQTPLDLRQDALDARPGLEELRLQYDLPFETRQAPPGDVLVLGAGTGNDVAAALRGGADRVDAVEIDPEIAALGFRHPEEPYNDPRVNLIVSDARSFLAGTDRRYDTVVFGLVDSHVLSSARSTVRLDSFVFTRESFELVRERLSPAGVVYVSHAVGAKWFQERMQATLEAAFGKPPFILTELIPHPFGVVYAAGERVPAGSPAPLGTVILEDDWPFPYLQFKAVPSQYLVTMLLISLISLVAVRGVSGKRLKGLDLHFFALGVGFMLVETRGLSVLALHLGSTWSASSAVFAGVLLMALLATVVAAKVPARTTTTVSRASYAALCLFLLLGFLIPLSTLSATPYGARIALSVGLVSLPILASGLIFAASLRRAGAAHMALASNLLGAMVGGLLEYMSMKTGFRYLLVLAVAFYFLAFAAEFRAAFRTSRSRL